MAAPRTTRRLPESLRRLGRAAAHRAERRRDRHALWQLAKPAAFAGVGLLLITSAVNADGTDFRPDRYNSLADLAEQQSDRLQTLRADLSDLTTEVEGLSSGLQSAQLDRLQEQLDSLAMPAGLMAVEGPGLTVILDDAPAAQQDAAGDDIKNTIVHQQDIQAVVNAMWAGGAEAMTLQGQRVISTTGIKCVGNSVILHGVPYSPPYVISAIGDSADMVGSLGNSPYIGAYLEAVADYQLGWDLVPERELLAPAYDGSLELRYAAEDVADRAGDTTDS